MLKNILVLSLILTFNGVITLRLNLLFKFLY
jgi:hypothetical protein